ncbi:DENN domain-containing protein 3-like [Plakobranchus ocellatus]|uniref:DENN domain-containing protein 3-like n=1 Tax=Plakobranchus ocellatus TaxID=259542 RepID=A0AAV3YYE8_9GAST|nr:DENN domain-containing protein 3-like [Plakobranchus ocellatus]
MADKVAEQMRLMHFNLYNRFAELMLVVGLDENTGLTPLHKDTPAASEDDEEEEENPFSNLFFKQYEAQVLAAISSSKALVFQPYLMEDPNYPPRPDLANGGMNSFESLRKTKLKGSSHSRRQVQAVNAAVIKQHLNKGDSSKSVADLPLSKDAIESITTFCFPDSAQVYRHKPDSNIHFLVLTDVSGCKTYASCLTFYKPYRLTKEGNGGTILFELLTDRSPSHKQAHSVDCFIPQCCVLVSKYPYFYAMKECLSCMISHVERDLEEMYQFIKDFTYTMTMAPVPPAGNVIVVSRLEYSQRH